MPSDYGCRACQGRMVEVLQNKEWCECYMSESVLDQVRTLPYLTYLMAIAGSIMV